jgi:Raf kinase inhibitor-like YbhB/YbcL family protein
MRISSAAFDNRQRIPVEYTCDGHNISPPITIEDVPDDTKSLALIVDDPDAPGGTFVHWIMYNIPPDSTELKEDIPENVLKLEQGGIQGRNSFGAIGYDGPCPPDGEHRYFFGLYALDTELDIRPGAIKEEITTKMTGHVLDKAELVGLYKR